MSYLPSHLLFLCTALTLSLLPLRVQAALPKELPTGLPDAFGRPVDHGGSGRRLPSERTGNEAEVGGYAEAAGIPEYPIASL